MDDLLIQLRAELTYRPDSYLTNEVMLWYDSLYRESEAIDSYDNSKEAPDGFQNYDFSSLQNLLISIAIEQGERQFKKLAKEAEKRLK